MSAPPDRPVRVGLDRPAVHAGPRRAPARGPRGTRSAGPTCSSRRWSSGWSFLSAGPILATFGISLTSWDLLTAAGVRRPRQLRRPARRPAVPRWRFATRPSTRWSRCRSGWRCRWASPWRSTRRSGGSPGSGRCTSCRSSPRRSRSGLVWAWIYSPDERPPQPAPGRLRDPGPEVGHRPVLGDALDHRDVDLAGAAGQHDHLPGRPPGDPARLLRRRQRRRRRPAGPVPARHAAAAHARACSSPGSSA